MIRRFRRSDPCPICGGHPYLRQGQGIRCWGGYDTDRRYARCTREEHRGQLAQNSDGTYSHRLEGECLCGETHGMGPPPIPQPRTSPGSRGGHHNGGMAADILVASLAVMCAIDRGGDDLHVHPCDGCEGAVLAGKGTIRCLSCREHTLTVEPAGADQVHLACTTCPEHQLREAIDGLGIPDRGLVVWREPPPPDWSQAKFLPAEVAS